MKTIILQPSAKARQAPDFNREAYVDFVAVQIKFLSFLAYIIRIYQDQVSIVQGAYVVVTKPCASWQMLMLLDVAL